MTPAPKKIRLCASMKAAVFIALSIIASAAEAAIVHALLNLKELAMTSMQREPANAIYAGQGKKDQPALSSARFDALEYPTTRCLLHHRRQRAFHKYAIGL